MINDFQEWMGATQSRVERALANYLPAADGIPPRLHAAMRYATLGGGKRVRPLLAFAAGEISAASQENLERVACALEMIHVYSLVHDDLPCMDDDVLRRGRATCHVEYDEPTALLVGDALQSLAFEVLAGMPNGSPERSVRMIRILAEAAGSRGMAGGQAIDLESVGKTLSEAELELMHALKTGALIRASVVLGGLCGAELTDGEFERLDRFGKRAGLLFQVVDDILDCTASTATLGKTAGKDQSNDKPTYVSLLGLDGARDFAQLLRSDAMACLEPFAERARRLRQLAEFIAEREF